ncbi:hypothetical protein KAJ27_23425 [bacterium]|nr:hypothetical protein [bacterium]
MPGIKLRIFHEEDGKTKQVFSTRLTENEFLPTGYIEKKVSIERLPKTPGF